MHQVLAVLHLQRWKCLLNVHMKNHNKLVMKYQLFFFTWGSTSNQTKQPNNHIWLYCMATRKVFTGKMWQISTGSFSSVSTRDLPPSIEQWDTVTLSWAPFSACLTCTSGRRPEEELLCVNSEFPFAIFSNDRRYQFDFGPGVPIASLNLQSWVDT